MPCPGDCRFTHPLNLNCFCRWPVYSAWALLLLPYHVMPGRGQDSSSLHTWEPPIPTVSPWQPCLVLLLVLSWPSCSKSPAAVQDVLPSRGKQTHRILEDGFCLRRQKDQDSITTRTVLTFEFKSICVACTHLSWLSFFLRFGTTNFPKMWIFIPFQIWRVSHYQ